MSDYSSNFPTQSPTFAFDAKAGKLDSRLSYSRSSSGTAVSSERHKSSENLVTQSDASNWTFSSSEFTKTASQAAPDGSTNGTKFAEKAAGSRSYIVTSNSCVPTVNQEITFAVWLKQTSGSRDYQQLRVGGIGSGKAFATYNLTNGTVDETGGTLGATASVNAGPTGWYQCILKFTPTATTAITINLASASASGGELPSVTGDTANSVTLFGAVVSNCGTVLNETFGQIHREYAPLLKTASADQPRFEYAADGQSVGLLIEAQATSLITYSEDFSNAFWDKTRLSIDSNVSVAPDGALTASALRVDGTAASTHRMRFTYATGGATAQTFSIFAKAGSKSWLALKFDSSGGAFDASIAYFNLASGTTGTVDSGITATINDCGNGWHRCSITRTALASATGQIELYVGEADNDVTIDGNSYDHILAWGAMVEANTSAPSSYIKSNSGSSTTKSADSCSVADFGYTGGPVSITTEVTAAASADGTQRVFTLFEGSDLVSTYFSGGGDIKTFVDVGGSTQVDASILANAVSGTDYNVGISFNTNDYRGAYNGTLGAADTSCTLPTFSSPTLQIGAQSGGSNPLSGHIKRLALYNVALSDVELQSLTSS